MKKYLKRNSLNLQEQINICNLYQNNNYSMQKIADIYSCSIKPINDILKNNKIIKRSYTRSLFNENYFEKIDSFDKAYFLGLLMADGCNYKEGFTLSLQERDYEIIELFKKYIKFTGKINYRKHTNPKYQNICRIKIHSKVISEQLSKLNVIPNKSLSCKFPNIPEEFHSHFIRGVFDGDGSISTYIQKNGIYNYKACSFSITGYKDLINDIEKILVKNCKIGFKKKYIKNNNEKILTIKYGGKKDIIKIYNWLYKDSKELFIKRKFLKFKEIEKWLIK